MHNSKLKILLSVILFVLVTAISMSVYAANDNIEIIKKSDTDYLIYIKDNLGEEFDFAYSNDNTVNRDNLTYKAAAQDDTDSANYIAYVNQYTTEHNYIWAKKANGTFILEAVELDLSKAIPEAELTAIQNVTKNIKVDTTKTHEEKEVVNGTTKILTTGKLVILDEGNFKYQIAKVEENSNEAKLMDLAERISKFNNSTDMYTKLGIYKEFNNLYKEMAGGLAADKWLAVENNEVLQPEEAENGTKYIVWLTDGETKDVQFLTCKKEYKEEKVIEEITTKLPVTYDNNTLLVVLGIVILAIVLVSIRIKALNKKEDK